MLRGDLYGHEPLSPEVRRICRERDVLLCQEANLESLVAFEQKYGVTMPEDFREFLLLSNGTDETLMEYLFLWPVQKIQRITEVFTGAGYEVLDPQSPKCLPSAANYFVFADYLIGSLFYAIALDPKTGIGSVVFVDGSNWYPCARSFSDFVDRYLQEAASPEFSGFLPLLKSDEMGPKN